MSTAAPNTDPNSCPPEATEKLSWSCHHLSCTESSLLTTREENNGSYNSLLTTWEENNGSYISLLTTWEENNGSYNSLLTTWEENNGSYNSLLTTWEENNGSYNSLLETYVRRITTHTAWLIMDLQKRISANSHVIWAIPKCFSKL